MIFAASDYFNYQRQTGRYSRACGTDVMCGAYEEFLPSEIMMALQYGDSILIGNYGWWLSWLIMYLTSSQVSHVTIYVGNERILHATLSGSEVVPVEDLFGPKVRLLVCKAPIPPERRSASEASEESLSKYCGRSYSRILVLYKGLNILTGRDFPYFRWKFFADIAFVVVTINIVAYLAWGRLTSFCVFIVAYLGVVFINYMRWPPKPSSLFFALRGNPCEIFWGLLKLGGAFMPDPTSPWTQKTWDSPNSVWDKQAFRRTDSERTD